MKQLSADTSRVRSHNNPGRGNARGFVEIGWNAVIFREMNERARGKNRELYILAGDSLGGGTDAAVASRDEDTPGIGAQSFENSGFELCGWHFVNVEGARG